MVLSSQFVVEKPPPPFPPSVLLSSSFFFKFIIFKSILFMYISHHCVSWGPHGVLFFKLDLVINHYFVNLTYGIK